MPQYREVKDDDIDELSEWVAESFLHYPYFSFCFRGKFSSDEEYLKFLKKYMRVEIEIYRSKTPAFVGVENARMISMAIFMNNKKSEIVEDDFLKAGLYNIEEFKDEAFLNRLDRIDEEAYDDIYSTYPKSWYWELLAVKPEMKGKGYGTQMINDCILPYVKSQGGEDLTLITNTEKHVKFYEHKGFRLFAERKIYEDEGKKGKFIDNYSLVYKLD